MPQGGGGHRGRMLLLWHLIWRDGYTASTPTKRLRALVPDFTAVCIICTICIIWKKKQGNLSTPGRFYGGLYNLHNLEEKAKNVTDQNAICILHINSNLIPFVA